MVKIGDVDAFDRWSITCATRARGGPCRPHCSSSLGLTASPAGDEFHVPVRWVRTPAAKAGAARSPALPHVEHALDGPPVTRKWWRRQYAVTLRYAVGRCKCGARPAHTMDYWPEVESRLIRIPSGPGPRPPSADARRALSTVAIHSTLVGTAGDHGSFHPCPRATVARLHFAYPHAAREHLCWIMLCGEFFSVFGQALTIRDLVLPAESARFLGLLLGAIASLSPRRLASSNSRRSWLRSWTSLAELAPRLSRLPAIPG